MDLFFLDFETTGLNPYLNDIIEIAIKKFNDDTYFQTLVQPRQLPPGIVKYIPPHITNITNITDQMIVDNSIKKSRAVYEMFQYIETNSDNDGPIYIISHNGTVFDFIIFRKIISEYFEKSKNTRFKKSIMNRIKYIDTLLLARFFITDKERINQKNLCKKYNIINEAEHRALGDINALEKIYIQLCKDYSILLNKEEGYILNNPDIIINHSYLH